MPFKIKSRANHLLIIPLNSGEAVHLAPGESSHPIEEFEIKGNEKMAKLLKANLIATTEVASEEASR